MNTKLYNLAVSYDEILELVQQLNDKDREKLAKEIDKISIEQPPAVSKEKMTRIMRIVKPYIKAKLGKNTHKKTSEEWDFYGLAFTHEDMVYVFGFNIGFFKTKSGDFYNNVGVNVLVRTNGEKPEHRQKFVTFFREQLKDWVNQPEGRYYSERGGEGIEFARYRSIDGLESDENIVEFLKETIDGVNKIYPLIAENNDNLFDKVVRAAPQWQEQIVDLCRIMLTDKT